MCLSEQILRWKKVEKRRLKVTDQFDPASKLVNFQFEIPNTPSEIVRHSLLTILPEAVGHSVHLKHTNRVSHTLWPSILEAGMRRIRLSQHRKGSATGW